MDVLPESKRPCVQIFEWRERAKMFGRIQGWFRRTGDFWVAFPLIVALLVLLAIRVDFSLRRYYGIQLFPWR
jgi:hypothetical protein